MRWASLAAVFMLFACCSPSSSSPSTDAGNSELGSSSPCASDPHAQNVAPGLSPETPAASFRVTLFSADPSPPIKGVNNWTFDVKDASGTALDGLSISITPWMPAHGHGSSIVPTIAPAGAAGRYVASDLDLVMPGIWQIKIAIAKGSAPSETAIFSVCVGG